MSVGERAETEFDQFIYHAGHDLQEPLRKVLSFGELLVRDLGTDLNEPARQDLHFITEATRRMQDLVEGLLMLSRMRRKPLTVQSVGLRHCVQSLLDERTVGASSSDAEIQVDDLPIVYGDQAMLAQVYRQLLDNALKFRADRPPRIRLTAERAGDEWLLRVEDNGIGIEAHQTEEIFAPFRRLHGRERYAGCGIGLTLCRIVVRRHGGRMWVESTPGVGSTFFFTLPIQPS